MKCPYCGAEVSETRCEFCDSDLTVYISQQMNQTSANTSETGESRSFININIGGQNGTPLNTGEELSAKKRNVALKLCILSFFIPGVHRLYTGKYISGIILLILGFMGLPRVFTTISSVIDLIAIINNTFRDKDGKLLC